VSKTRIITWCVLWAAVAAGLIGCDTVKTSDEDVLVISEKDVADLLTTRKAKVLLVDVRPPDQFRQSHIPGAINLPVAQIYPDDARLAGAKTIVVYANNWNDPLSRAAAKTLIRCGYKATVYEFKGGIEVWRESDRGLVGSGQVGAAGERPESGR